MKKIVLNVLLVLFIVSLGACNLNIKFIRTTDDYDVKTIKTEEQLAKYVFHNDNYYDHLRVGDAMPAPESNGSSTKGDSDTTNQNDTSQTNVQVEGVDESDIVKNNERYIYIANRANLTIIDTEDEQAFTHEFASYAPTEMFLYKNYLILFGVKTNTNLIDEESKANEFFYDYSYYYRQHYFKTIVLDVSDPKSPIITREFEMIDSYYLEGRMIDNNLYLILKNYNLYTYKTKDLIIPKYSDTAEGVTEKSLAMEDILVFGGDMSYYTYHILVSFNVEENHKPHLKAYLGDVQVAYSSKNNLYLTRNASLPRKTTIFDQNTSNDQRYNEYTYHTVIHRFEYIKGEMVYQAKAIVKGFIKNQFFIDEYQDILRIAHTIFDYDQNWFLKTETFVTTFDIKTKGAFTKLGSVGGMGIDENVYSCRFTEELGYIVTFYIIDPLYVVDLSNPSKPTVKSELKTPGVSDYLHLVNEQLLLGIGRSTIGEDGIGGFDGVKLSLFNIEDDDETIEVDIYKIESLYSDTSVQYNHKNLVTLPSRQIYALPIWANNAQDMYVFQIDPKNEKINLLGIISHDEDFSYYDMYYNYSIFKGVIVRGQIYTISPYLVKVNDLDQGLNFYKNYSLFNR